MASRGNPSRHAFTLGAFQVAWGGFMAVAGVVLAAAEAGPQEALAAALTDAGLGFVAAAGVVAAGVLLAILGAGAVVAGVGVLMRRPWGRALTFVYGVVAAVLAVVLILADPFWALLHGAWTAYVFWTLTRPNVAALFRPDLAAA